MHTTVEPIAGRVPAGVIWVNAATTRRSARAPAAESDFIYTLPFSLTGYPCVAVRAGSSKDGLPIGVQITGRPWRDDVAIAISHLVQTALGGWQPPPLLAER